MSAIHRIRDILELDGPTFFKVAYRLPAYEGATRLALQDWIEDLQELAQIEEESKYPPRYVDVDLDEMREKEGRLNLSQPVTREDRPATLEELSASGPAAPLLGQMAPVFEIVKVED